MSAFRKHTKIFWCVFFVTWSSALNQRFQTVLYAFYSKKMCSFPTEGCYWNNVTFSMTFFSANPLIIFGRTYKMASFFKATTIDILLINEITSWTIIVFWWDSWRLFKITFFLVLSTTWFSSYFRDLYNGSYCTELENNLWFVD